MKKKFSILLLAACLTASLTGCGTKDEVKVISKDHPAKETDSSAKKDNSEQKETEKTNVSSQPNLTGYIFQTQGTSGMISIGTDIDAAPVIQSLGEPDSYFEAPSCAFQGIDKIYTYNHFEIDTYPDGDTDKISMILFLDDLVSTSEGVCIGMTKEDMEKVYGTDYEVSNGFYRYTKDNMKLSFIIKDGEITSIEYDSLALNQGQ